MYSTNIKYIVERKGHGEEIASLKEKKRKKKKVVRVSGELLVNNLAPLYSIVEKSLPKVADLIGESLTGNEQPILPLLYSSGNRPDQEFLFCQKCTQLPSPINKARNAPWIGLFRTPLKTKKALQKQNITGTMSQGL